MERFFPGTKGFINLGKDSGGGGCFKFLSGYIYKKKDTHQPWVAGAEMQEFALS